MIKTFVFRSKRTHTHRYNQRIIFEIYGRDSRINYTRPKYILLRVAERLMCSKSLIYLFHVFFFFPRIIKRGVCRANMQHKGGNTAADL